MYVNISIPWALFACLLFLHQRAVNCKALPPSATNEPTLYSEKDEVEFLNKDNIMSLFGQERAAFVEFYSHWCGACKNIHSLTLIIIFYYFKITCVKKANVTQNTGKKSLKPQSSGTLKLFAWPRSTAPIRKTQTPVQTLELLTTQHWSSFLPMLNTKTKNTTLFWSKPKTTQC